MAVEPFNRIFGPTTSGLDPSFTFLFSSMIMGNVTGGGMEALNIGLRVFD